MSHAAFTVRRARPEDGDAMAEIYRPFVTGTAVTFDEMPPTGDAFAERLRTSGLPAFVAERDGRVVGYATAAPHGTRASFRWSTNLAVYVDPAHARGGVARTLYAALLPTLRDLNYVRAYAAITLPHPASVGLHESLGFRPVAVFPAAGYKCGAWHDVGWWELLLTPLPNPPAEPKSTTAAG